MDARNIYRVFDWLWTSGQLSEQDIAELPSLGIEVVINLAAPSSASALVGEAEFVTRRGITYVQIPVEWEAPRVDQFDQFVSVMQAFADRKIWLHCGMNMRVGVFLYLFRKFVRGEAEEQAMFPLRAVWQPNEIWTAFMAQVNAVYGSRSIPSGSSTLPEVSE